MQIKFSRKCYQCNDSCLYFLFFRIGFQDTYSQY